MSRAAERWWLVFLLAACACLDLYGLGAASLFDQDETAYAQIAVEMLHTGDPVTLHVNGQPWYVHPPFYMWLVAATGHFLGFTPFTVRIWSVLFSLLAVYTTVLLGRAFFGGRVGLLAGAILAVTLQFLVQSRLAVFDTVLLAWMLLAFYAFYRGYQTGRRADYLRFFLFAGLATLTKGPIGLVLPGLVIVGFVTLRRAWGRWREVPWGAGIAVYAGVGLLWYAVEIILHGRAFIASNVGYYTLGRFFGVVEKHAGPWYFYLPVALLGGVPWSAFWPAAAALHLRRWRVDGSLIVLLWTALPFVFYSAARTKLPGYIMPIFPFAAIGVAVLWDTLLERRRVDRPAGSLLGPALAVAALFLGVGAAFLGARYLGPYRTSWMVFLPPLAVLVGGGLGVILMAARGRALPAFVVLCATMAAAWFAFLPSALPVVEAQKPIMPLALFLKTLVEPGDRIVGYRMSLSTSLVYYTGHRIEWAETPETLRAELCAPGRVFLVINREELVALPFPGKTFDLRLIAERADHFVFLKSTPAGCPAKVVS
jgi:4-amino-4-deoxy-L-arabinose transferase-like glycosyltransferase